MPFVLGCSVCRQFPSGEVAFGAKCDCGATLRAWMLAPDCFIPKEGLVPVPLVPAATTAGTSGNIHGVPFEAWRAVATGADAGAEALNRRPVARVANVAPEGLADTFHVLSLLESGMGGSPDHRVTIKALYTELMELRESWEALPHEWSMTVPDEVLRFIEKARDLAASIP